MACLPVPADPCRRQLKLKKHSLRVCRRSRGRRWAITRKKTEMKNWKLYMENKAMILQNEYLKKKVYLLHEENKELLSQLSRTTAAQAPTQPKVLNYDV